MHHVGLTMVQRGSQTATNVRFGSKVDMCSARAHVRFTPERGHVALQLAMSAKGQ